MQVSRQHEKSLRNKFMLVTMTLSLKIIYIQTKVLFGYVFYQTHTFIKTGNARTRNKKGSQTFLSNINQLFIPSDIIIIGEGGGIV